MASRPELSVIVPSVTGAESLLECLEAVEQSAAGDVSLEIIVVDRCGEQLRQAVSSRFPGVRLLTAPHDASIPLMRMMGFRHARADNVAVIEDHVLVETRWARKMVAAIAGHDAVGGSVSNGATGSLVDWAAFLCEYSHLLQPVRGATASMLAGNNVAYRRAVLDKYADVLSKGRWEDALHDAMRRDGVVLTCEPEITVRHKMHYTIAEYLSQRYLYARSYAGLKRSDMSGARRAMLTLGSFALPPVLLGRIWRRVRATGQHQSELVRSLPLLALFVCAWALGEAVGYAAGPGTALARVR